MKVYFHISGRLGNQLFQWSVLHELAYNGFDIYLFTDKYHNNLDGDQDLDKLLDHCSHLPKIKIRNDLGFALKVYEKLINCGLLGRLVAGRLPILIEELPNERSKYKPLLIIDGFFIDQKWPKKHEKNLLIELNKVLDEGKTESKLQHYGIKKGLTTFHVRRGDYHQYKETFGLLSSTYYLNFVNSEEQEVVVLTDSYEEVKNTFKSQKNFLLVEPEIFDVWDSLFIMRNAEQLIMGNSTLSWWGGFLAFFSNRAEVIMPRPFYALPGKFDSKLAFENFKFEDSIFE